MRDDEERDSSESEDLQGLDVFEGYGSYGLSSDELPALRPDDRMDHRHPQSQAVISGPQARMWQAEQAREAQQARQREERMTRIHALYSEGRLSGAAYDFLQAEFSLGLLPEVYREHATNSGAGGTGGQWMVWSAHERQLYTLASFEVHVQTQLAIDDPERQTMILPALPWSPWQRQWHPLLDSQMPGARAPRPRPTPRLLRPTTTERR